MLLTVQQASECWCPFKREPITGETRQSAELTLVAGNADQGGVAIGRCFTTGCMAWRWEGPAPRIERTAQSVEAQSKRVGYCGLAGRPGLAR